MSDDMSRAGTSPATDENTHHATWDDIVAGGKSDIDAAEVRRALELFTDPSNAFEIRGLYGAGKAHGEVCRTIEDGIRAAVDRDRCVVTWLVLNPIEASAPSAKKTTVVSRRWFLVDIDVNRPDDCASTDEEKIAARGIVDRILDFLGDRGWPGPVVDDSGNGWHMLYRVDLPNTDLSQQVIKSALKSLGDRFDTEFAHVDRGCHDAPRCCKLPGTWVRKDPELPGRPHRMARIVWVPEAIGIVSQEQLLALTGEKPVPVNGQVPDPPVWKDVAAGGLGKWVREAIDRECGKVAMTLPGSAGGVGRNNQLNTSAFKLGQLAGWPEMDRGYAQSMLERAALLCGLDADANCGPEGIAGTIQSGWTSGEGHPRARPAQPGTNGQAANGRANGHVPKPSIIPPPGKRIVWAKDVKQTKVQWLDPGRVPIGKMTTFAGQTGVGKTFTVCDLAARVTSGQEIPFRGGECYQQGKVLIISAEDDADDTIVPRFCSLGGDMNRLALLSPESEDQFDMAAIDLLNGCLDDMGPDVRMIAIDPPTSFLGKVDDHKNSELRGLLQPLRNFCRARRIALIFVTHINKGGGAQKVEALARVMGSAAWVQAVRSAQMFCKDFQDPRRSLYLPLKVNNFGVRKGLAYRIVGQANDMATLEWIEEVDMSADDAINQTLPKKSAGMTAVEWLVDRFRENYEWASADLKRLAQDAGLSFNQVFKSSEVNALPIDKRCRSNANGESYWVWRARQGWPGPIKQKPPTIPTSETPESPESGSVSTDQATLF